MKNYDLMFLKWYGLLTIPSWVIIIVGALRGSSDDWLNASAGILIGLWISASTYIMAKMVFVNSYRESLLAKIFQQKISDERENLISGEAIKKTYFFTSSVILGLLFLSVLKVSFYNPTKEDRELGKKGTISIGIGYSIVSKNAIKKEPTEFSLQELPLTKEFVLSLIFLLQFVSYHRYFKKQLPS